MTSPGNCEWKKTRITGSVLASGFVGGAIVTPGAIYCLEGIAPGAMAWFKKLFAKHFTEPHLAFFEKLSAGLHSAHTRYDEKRAGQLLVQGNAEEALEVTKRAERTREERAYIVADTLVTALIAIGVDLLSSFGLQKGFGWLLGVDHHVKASHIAITENAATWAAVALMPMPGIARFSENINHWISRKFRSTFGMEKDRAEDLSVPFTYVGVPSLLGTLAAVAHGLVQGTRSR